MFKRWLKIPEYNALVLGPRRAGKTTLLKSLFPHYTYLTLDDLDLYSLAKKDPKGSVLQRGEKIIIDEIQRIPELTIAVKYAIDELKKIVLMTGSSAIGLLNAHADSLAGRINIFHLPPLCFGEDEGEPDHSIFDDELDEIKVKRKNRLLDQTLLYGGFPEVLLCSDEEKKQEVIKRYRDTYFTRDLLQLSHIEDLEGLMGILYHLARSIGSIADVSHFARESGLSHPTAKKYLNVLFQSELIFKLYGYQYGPAKKFIKSPKNYYIDNSMIKALNLNLSDGQIIESFVISEFEKRRKLGFYQCDYLNFYHSSSGSEVDLIIEEDKVTRVIEIKNSTQINPRKLGRLQEFINQKKDRRKGYIFYRGLNYQTIDGIKFIPIASLHRGV